LLRFVSWLIPLIPMGLAFAAEDTSQSNIEVIGSLQTDYIQDFKRVDGNWDDTLRPSKIPTQEGQFGADGQAIIGVRQSGMGVRFAVPAGAHELKGLFYFDLFGSGANEGETTFHLSRAYAEWGSLLAGYFYTSFMDVDISPNVIDYWGPPGMVYVKNPQLRWTALDDDRYRIAVAIERPSDDIDPGQIRDFDPVLGENLQSDEEIPDLTAQFRMKGDWGHLQTAALFRRIGFETAGTPNNEPSGDEFGWGVNVTSAINLFGGDDQLLVGVVYGEGIASYMNDGGTDLSANGTFAAPEPTTVELLGVSAYYNHQWNERWTSAIGYSRTEVNNTDLQSDDAFKFGAYASANLLFSPDEHVLIGAEALWGQREDKNGQNGDDVRIQFTVRYSFTTVVLTR
jgi:DcaP outer membrane protein